MLPVGSDMAFSKSFFFFFVFNRFWLQNMGVKEERMMLH